MRTLGRSHAADPRGEQQAAGQARRTASAAYTARYRNLRYTTRTGDRAERHDSDEPRPDDVVDRCAARSSSQPNRRRATAVGTRRSTLGHGDEGHPDGDERPRAPQRPASRADVPGRAAPHLARERRRLTGRTPPASDRRLRHDRAGPFTGRSCRGAGASENRLGEVGLALCVVIVAAACRPAASTPRPDQGRSTADRCGRRRVVQLHRERDPRRALRRGTRARGHPVFAASSISDRGAGRPGARPGSGRRRAGVPRHRVALRRSGCSRRRRTIRLPACGAQSSDRRAGTSSVLQPAAAQDQNGVALTLDRAPGASGTQRQRSPPTRRSRAGRPSGVPDSGLLPASGCAASTGCTSADFVPLANQAQKKIALEQGVIDVAVMFTTDAHFADPSLVVLDDDRHLQPAENVVPVVSTRALRDVRPRVVTSVLERECRRS